MFDTQYKNWQRRKRNLGDRAVGRRDEDLSGQTKRIAKRLATTLESAYYDHCLDFGCGWGRFSKLLADHCGHLWVADLFDDWVKRAASVDVITSPVVMRSQKLPIADESMDLVIDVMTLQSIDNDGLARRAMHELRRVAAPGAFVISLHIMKPRSPTRTAAQRASHLGLSKWHEQVIADVDVVDAQYSYLVGTRI